MGIPTRVVVGFLGGNYDANADITRYSYYDLYGWLEVWDANFGWIPFPALPYYKLSINLVPWFSAHIIAPRTLQGYPTSFINDTIDITFTLYGNFAQLSAHNIVLYDLNESSIINMGTFSTVNPTFRK